jgi:cytochrome c heme-lyase
MGAAQSSRAGASPAGATPAAPAAGASACPVPEELRSRAVYNVYSQRVDAGAPAPGGAPPPAAAALARASLLDPANNMPLEANQQPCPGQTKLLPTRREPSNIPRGGTDAAWLYPSPQMFYNALKRKGKGDDVVEDDMRAVVATHNAMNEATWRRVLAWEALHRDACAAPALTRFVGRPDELSPAARARAALGGPTPFDRHDWFVDRCGREVRYVIDFYFDESKAGAPDAFEIVARPALDSPTAALDHLKMFVYTNFASWGLPCPVTGEPGAVGAAALEPDRA